MTKIVKIVIDFYSQQNGIKVLIMLIEVVLKIDLLSKKPSFLV